MRRARCFPGLRVLRVEGAQSKDLAFRKIDMKAKFSELIERAQSEGPQIITRKGHKTAVVVAAEEWERKTRQRGSLAEFLASSPLRGSGLQIKLVRNKVRKIQL